MALGATTKPAVHHWLTPAFESWGVPYWVADVAGFVLALIIVTFLHLVVGEMAPKSWAIAHPERSATMLALPMRAFMFATRPILVTLNNMANWCLRKVGVEPADQIASGQNPDDLRHLVEHSVNVGALDASYSVQISGALELQRLTVGELVRSPGLPTSVPSTGTIDDARAAALESGHLRILVRDGATVSGVVHVRDTLNGAVPLAEVTRPVFTLTADTPVYVALASMRETSSHLALVTRDDTTVGVVTLSDVLSRLLPTAGVAV